MQKPEIYRVLTAGGEKQLYTSIPLPHGLFVQEKAGFNILARLMGENITIVSPPARDILGI